MQKEKQNKETVIGTGVTYSFNKLFGQKCDELGVTRAKIMRQLLEMWMHGNIEIKDDSDYVTKRELNEKLDEVKKEILISLKSENSGSNNQ